MKNDQAQPIRKSEITSLELEISWATMMDLKVVQYLNRGRGGKAAMGRSVNKMQCIRVLRNHRAASYWLCVWCIGERTRVSPQSFSFCSTLKSFNTVLLQFVVNFLGCTKTLSFNKIKRACCFSGTSSSYSHVFTFNSVVHQAFYCWQVCCFTGAVGGHPAGHFYRSYWAKWKRNVYFNFRWCPNGPASNFPVRTPFLLTGPMVWTL